MNDAADDTLYHSTVNETKKTRSPMIHGYVVQPGVIEFRQGDAVLDTIHMNRIPHDVQNRYAIEGVVRAYLSGTDSPDLMSGDKLPKRVPPEVRKVSDGPSKAALKAAAVRDAAKAKWEAAMHRAAELGAPPPE